MDRRSRCDRLIVVKLLLSVAAETIGKEEVTMLSFDVRFIKTVCDDTGHEHRACQALFNVQAPSLSEAVRQAEAIFCRQKQVQDWTIFADAVELKSPIAAAA
jgi:hypothetical protein